MPMSRLMKHELLMELWVSVCIAEEMGLMIFKGPFHLKWIYDSISAAFHWQKKAKIGSPFLVILLSYETDMAWIKFTVQFP